MNPWLEVHWGDVHTSLTTYARDQLQQHLPADLRARIEECVAVETDASPGGPRSVFAPDVHVIERPDAPVESDVPGSPAAVAEPLIVSRLTEPETLRGILRGDGYGN